MRFSRTQYGSARVTCLSLFFVCANAVVAAQESGSVNDVGSDHAEVSAAHEANEGALYKIPVVLPEMQEPGTTGVHAPDANFFERLGGFYKADWTGKPPSTTAPARRALDAPLESPPFPSSDWGYGGSPAIGVPDGNVYPLMTALKMQNSRTKIYGWVAGSVNASTSSKNNFPVSYDIFPNRVELNQAVVYLERLPNTVQKTHFDWVTTSLRSTALTTDLRRPKVTLVNSYCRRTVSTALIRCGNM